MAGEKDIIFSIQDLSRVYGRKTVLTDITLGFYHGAKIGLIGRIRIWWWVKRCERRMRKEALFVDPKEVYGRSPATRQNLSL